MITIMGMVTALQVRQKKAIANIASTKRPVYPAFCLRIKKTGALLNY